MKRILLLAALVCIFCSASAQWGYGYGGYNYLTDPNYAAAQIAAQMRAQQAAAAGYQNQQMPSNIWSRFKPSSVPPAVVPSAPVNSSVSSETSSYSSPSSSSTNSSRTCRHCKGTGRITVNDNPSANFGYDRQKVKCPECGEMYDPDVRNHYHIPCPHCR